MMITVIDYGAGNLRSVVNAFAAIGKSVLVTTDPRRLEEAPAIVLPGVGAFGEGIENLRSLGFIKPLNEHVMGKKKPYLGICLGMQFLAKSSFENGCHAGLGWIQGCVRSIPDLGDEFKVPHMGWNDIHIEGESSLLKGLPSGTAFYFVHSYHLDVEPEDMSAVTSTCWHGMKLTASVQRGNIFGVQFHPEKSQRAGLTVLENFVEYCRQC